MSTLLGKGEMHVMPCSNSTSSSSRLCLRVQAVCDKQGPTNHSL